MPPYSERSYNLVYDVSIVFIYPNNVGLLASFVFVETTLIYTALWSIKYFLLDITLPDNSTFWVFGGNRGFALLSGTIPEELLDVAYKYMFRLSVNDYASFTYKYRGEPQVSHDVQLSAPSGDEKNSCGVEKANKPLDKVRVFSIITMLSAFTTTFICCLVSG